MTYEEFVARARSAKARPLAKELRQLYVDDGTLAVLVLMILQQRESLAEALFGKHMVNQEAIYAAIGTQGQVSGVDIILRSIYEAMTDEPPDEVSPEPGSQVP